MLYGFSGGSNRSEESVIGKMLAILSAALFFSQTKSGCQVVQIAPVHV